MKERKKFTMHDVGVTRSRLGKAITKAFKAAGIEAFVDPGKLRPAQGRWRSDVRMDVVRWEGSIEVFQNDKWNIARISSWDRMANCVKGFTIWRERGWHYEVGARRAPKKTAKFLYEDVK